jgi:hypothetical protein
LLIVKALYGVRSSGLQWHEKFADCLRDLGFIPCKMRPNREKNVGVYVDDLAIALRSPKY